MANFRYNPSSGKIERAESSQLTTRFFVMQEGRLHSLGRPGDVITESNISEVYRVNVVVDHHPLTGLPRVSLLGSHSPGQESRWESGAAPQL